MRIVTMIWNIVVYICVLVSTCHGFLLNFWNNNGTTTTTQNPLNATTEANLPGNGEIDPVKAEAGAIAGAVFGIVVCLLVVGVSGIIYFKRKREQDLEYHRKTKVLKQSSQSAGVYMDTTSQVAVKTHNTNNRGQEYKSLNRDPNLYESESEDEL